jgi:ABC-2 type transport system permease protein
VSRLGAALPYNSRVATTVETGFTTPGTSRGLLSVFEYRYLLGRLVRKEVSVRYHGSFLGWLWSFAKPVAQFGVYYLAVGVFIRVGGTIEAYPVYLFAGLIILNFFSEALGNATKSLTDNEELIRKIYLPRELFPSASVIVAFINFIPQLVVLLVVVLCLGWHPTILSIAAILVAVVIVGLFALGLGLLLGALNALFRDAQNFVELILVVVVWLSPVLYQETLLQNMPAWIGILYRLNPLTPAVELMHYGFWESTITGPGLPFDGFSWFTLIAFGIACAFVVVGQLVFRRLEGRFAQDI